MDSPNLHPPESESPAARSSTALRELQERAQATIAARREKASQFEADLTAQLDSITAALANLQSAESTTAAEATPLHDEIKRLNTALEDAQNAAQLERAAWESEREALEKERGLAETERTNFQTERSAWETDRTQFETDRAAWDAERSRLTDEVARLEQARLASLDENADSNQASEQLAELERKLLEQRTAADRDAADWKTEREALKAEREELRQKFSLALEDVQRFRARVAELEQDLARRPAAGAADSAELVALRVERDTLAERIAQLESQPTPKLDSNAEQQFSDLQRRFEMAVEDVRELKNKNAKLEAQLTTAKSHASSHDAGGMDWESQKRRLLASLEDAREDGEEPISEKDQLTVKGAIEITDAVVAEKDQIIAELRAEIEAGANYDPAAVADAEREIAVQTLIDADEIIASHRQKSAQYAQEMESKLRAAELELSVERAKIARQRAELEELRSDLESQRASHTGSAPPAAPGTPRRRWLSKLGLNGDDEK